MNAALILSRVDSKRFPGKAITNLGSKKLIKWCIDGVLNIDNIEPIIVTTDRSIDDPLADIAKESKIKVYRGSLNNVAKRVFDCINHYDIDIFARINGDSPFINKDLIEEAVSRFDIDEKIDFVTNLIPREFPYGLSVEMMKSSTFRMYYPRIQSQHHQEHLTSWFYENEEKINISKIAYSEGNDHDLKFAIDTEEDHKVIERVINENLDFNFYNSSIKETVKLFRIKRQSK